MTFNPQPKPTKGRKKRVKPSGGALHMKLVKGLPCVICGAWGPTDAHHCRSDSFGGKRASDYAVIPLCKLCHMVGYAAFHVNKGGWEERNGPDWSYIPQTLQAIYGDQFSEDH